MSIPVGPNTNILVGHKLAGISHQHTFINDGTHLLTGTGSVTQQLQAAGATTVAGSAAYSHLPSGLGMNVGAQNTNKGMGTVGTVGASMSITPNVNAFAQCTKHMSSRSKAVCEGGLSFHKKF